LSGFGPTPWLVGAVTAAEVGVVAAAIAWVGCPRTPVASTTPAVASTTPAQAEAVATAEPPEPPKPEASGDEETVVLPRDTSPPAA
jgi:hypothetical protein